MQKKNSQKVKTVSSFGITSISTGSPFGWFSAFCLSLVNFTKWIANAEKEQPKGEDSASYNVFEERYASYFAKFRRRVYQLFDYNKKIFFLYFLHIYSKNLPYPLPIEYTKYASSILSWFNS